VFYHTHFNVILPTPLDVSRREECLTACKALIIHKLRYRHLDCLSLAQGRSQIIQKHAHIRVHCILFVKINSIRTLFNTPLSNVKFSIYEDEYEWSVRNMELYQ
jgi:hypothetical protein